MLIFTVVVVFTISKVSATNDSLSFDCPTWQLYNITSEKCECGDSIHSAVKCNETTNDVELLDCYCMTLNQKRQMEVGKCLIGCEHSPLKTDSVFNPLPQDKLKLNDWLCGELNKNGTSCGLCEIGYSRVVYSYDIGCHKCTSSHSHNVAKFIAAAFGPLTLFYIIVVIFKVSATSPQLSSFVIFSQWISEPISTRVILRSTRRFPKIDIFARILSSAYAIWNLDFFRTLYPPICLDVSTLLTLALDYVGAFYTLFLILVTYLLIRMHSRNVRVIVYIWKPIEYILTQFEEQWSTKASMVNVFSTFFLLTYVKLISVSFTLLLPTYMYDIHGNCIGAFLYYDASIPYFGREHLPYAIIAIFISVLFVVIPTLFLSLYPFKWFQHCLNCLQVSGMCPAIHTFADCFLGWYKDGTEKGTRDCRFVGSLYLIIRIAMFITYGFSLSLYVYAFASVVMILFAIVISFLKPYKDQWAFYNIVSPAMVLVVAMWYGTIICINIASEKAFELIYFSAILSSIVGILPLLCGIAVILRWLFKKTSRFSRLCKLLKLNRRTNYSEYEPLEDSVVPHRMDHPEQYDGRAANSAIQILI